MNPDTDSPSSKPSRITPKQWGFAFVILALAAGVVGYRFLTYQKLNQTAALFIGLPALMSILVAFTPKAKTVTGMLMKSMTLFLLISGMFLGEGFLCILFAAPIFYGVALIIGLPSDYLRRKNRNRDRYGLLILPIVLLSMEGVNPKTSFSRDETVTVFRVVEASPETVEALMGEVPHFKKDLPFFLGLGFPRPISTAGSGLQEGDCRTIRFSGSEGQIGGEGKAGNLILKIQDVHPGFVRFVVVSDESHIPHWLRWKGSVVRWSRLDDRHTLVSWKISYSRSLDPSWYFRTIERYAVTQAAGYLADNLAMP